MQTRKILNLMTGTLIICLLSLAAQADISGNWSGSMATPNGNVTINYTFMENGNEITGSTMGPDGQAIDISEGKLEGSSLSFVVVADFQGQAMTVNYRGEVKDDSIDLNVNVFGQSFPLTIERSDSSEG